MKINLVFFALAFSDRKFCYLLHNIFCFFFYLEHEKIESWNNSVTYDKIISDEIAFSSNNFSSVTVRLYHYVIPYLLINFKAGFSLTDYAEMHTFSIMPLCFITFILKLMLFCYNLDSVSSNH